MAVPVMPGSVGVAILESAVPIHQLSPEGSSSYSALALPAKSRPPRAGRGLWKSQTPSLSLNPDSPARRGSLWRQLPIAPGVS